MGTSMNLVVGATGLLGLAICTRLVAAGKHVRALVRPSSDPCAVERLRSLGCEIVTGDLTRPETLATALEGTSAVISSATALGGRGAGHAIDEVDLRGQQCLVDLAQASGTGRLLYVSCARGDSPEDPLSRAQRSVERHLRASGLAFTILRPTCVMERWLGPVAGFDLAARSVTIYGSARCRVNWIAARDVAEIAVRCLEDPDSAGLTFDLGGPEALSPEEVVQLAEEIGGRPIDVERVSLAELAERSAAARGTDEESLVALQMYVARGAVIDMDRTLQRFPISLTPIREHVRGSL